MSLLNDMLKDLHGKQSKSASAVLVTFAKSSWQEKLPTVFFWLTFVLMLIGFTYALAFWTNHPTASPVTDKPIQLQSEIAPIIMPNTPLDDEESLENNDEWMADDENVEDKKEVSVQEEDWLHKELNKALEAIEDGNDDHAIDLLSFILVKHPSCIEARENLAALYLSHQEFKSAQDVLDEGLQKEPFNLRLTTMKSRILFEQGDTQKALALLEKYNPDMNKAPEYYALLAAIFESLGRTNAAGSLYQALVKIDPSNGQYWLGLGVAFEQAHSTQQAIEAYRRASQSDNSQPAVRIYAENRLKTLQG